jgi:hypothetical protein
MKRIIAIVACVVVACALIGGVVVLALDGGPTAARVGDRTVSQQDVDDELRALIENDALQRVVKASRSPALSNSEGSITAQAGSGWLGLIVAQHLAADAVQRRGLHVTSADRDHGRRLARQSVGGTKVFASLPEWFRDRLVERWAPVARLEREIAAHPTPAVLQALGSQCPSGRYVSHILVESESEALSIKQQLDAGASFADLARRNSIDTASAKRGGQLGCIDGQSFVEPFATVAATLPPGVVSDPVTTQYGSHLVLVSDTPPAATVRQLAVQAALAGGRGVAVEIDPRYGTWDRANGRVVPPVASSTPTTAPTG